MRYLLLLGGNLGDVESMFGKAIRKLSRCGTVEDISCVYKSEAWGFEAQEIFRNMCVELRSPLEPMAMLDELQAIERELGRTHKSVNGVYQSRTVDIDILLADDVRISNERLTVPHKLMYEREFALVPAREKWGEWVERNRPQ